MKNVLESLKINAPFERVSQQTIIGSSEINNSRLILKGIEA